MTSADVLKPAPAKNLPYLVFKGLTAVCAIPALVLLLTGEYVEVGYEKIDDGSIDGSVAGMQIWGLHLFGMLLTLCLPLTGFICWAWQREWGSAPRWWQVLPAFALLIAGLITFYPWPFELQVRHYDGPAFPTYVLLAQGSADFVDGNEESFYGYREEITEQTLYGERDRYFHCLTERAWWWGKLTILWRFFAVLDSENEQRLLETRCKEVGLR